MIPNLIEIYCFIENFTKKVDTFFSKTAVGRKPTLTGAEYLTILLIKQYYKIQNTKQLYELLKLTPGNGFSELPSYQQFCRGIESVFVYVVPLMKLLSRLNLVKDKNQEFIVDSTKLPVCKIINASKCRKTNKNASYGKTIEGWFFGYKLHLIVTTTMDIISFKITTGAVADIIALTSTFTDKITGVLIGDKGYLSQKKTKELLLKDLLLVTRQRKNMKSKPASSNLIKLLKKRSRIETVFGQLKDNYLLINTKCRSIFTYFVHVFTSMIAYTLDRKIDLSLLDLHIDSLLIS